MVDFEYYNPAKIVFGENSIDKIGELLKENNATKLLMVYSGEFIKELGIYGKVKLIIFDLSTISKEGLMQNKIIASIEQSPRLQGYNAIKGIYSDLLYGNQPEKINHYVPTKIVLKENLIYG